ncbi:unnamed protein product, partial [Hapterophycus canaliculatus]
RAPRKKKTKKLSNIGRNVESSKKRARWKFCFGEEGREHEVWVLL